MRGMSLDLAARSVLLSAALLAAAGCATPVSHGLVASAQQLDAFKPGATTLDEVIAALGEPDSVQPAPDGGRLIVYIFRRTRIDPPSLDLPSGAAPRADEADVQLASFLFDAQGRLVSRSGASRAAGK
jgi:hypothetical protein